MGQAIGGGYNERAECTLMLVNRYRKHEKNVNKSKKELILLHTVN